MNKKGVSEGWALFVIIAFFVCFIGGIVWLVCYRLDMFVSSSNEACKALGYDGFFQQYQQTYCIKEGKLTHVIQDCSQFKCKVAIPEK